jgi:hypothetical protein
MHVFPVLYDPREPKPSITYENKNGIEVTVTNLCRNRSRRMIHPYTQPTRVVARSRKHNREGYRPLMGSQGKRDDDECEYRGFQIDCSIRHPREEPDAPSARHCGSPIHLEQFLFVSRQGRK